MNYVIGNVADLAAFNDVVLSVRQIPLPFTYCYIDAPNEDGINGGFGCLRFDFPVPDKIFFEPPSVEYRYSTELNEWVSNGQPTPISWYVESVYNYFVTREGEQQ